MKLKLSAAKLKTLTVPEGKSGEYVWDTSLPGFGVYVGKTAKTFLVQFTTRAGEEKRHKIGRSDVLSYDAARQEAIRILGEVQNRLRQTVPQDEQQGPRILDHEPASRPRRPVSEQRPD